MNRPFPAETPIWGVVRRLGRRAKLALRTTIKRSPVLYMPLARLRNGTNDGVDPITSASPEAVRRDTELVIEAAGSSGNTFAVIAFRLAQARPVSLAHHLHATAQVKRAVQRGIPALVIIRHPRDVATSRVIRHPPITMEEALREWCAFYEAIEPAPNVLLADFRAVTTDFGAVIRQLNRQCNTGFRVFAHTDENVARVFRIMDEVYRRRGGEDLSRMVARPTPRRDTERSVLLTHYMGPDLARLRERAENVYWRLAGSAAPVVTIRRDPSLQSG